MLVDKGQVRTTKINRPVKQKGCSSESVKASECIEIPMFKTVGMHLLKT